MSTRTKDTGIIWQTAIREPYACEEDAIFRQFLDETVEELDITTDRQGRQFRVIIIPTPSLSQQVGILHREIGNDTATDGVNTHQLHTLHKRFQVIVIKGRIEASHTIEIPVKGVILYAACIIELRTKLIGASKTVECRDCRNQFHGRGRTQRLSLVHLI